MFRLIAAVLALAASYSAAVAGFSFEEEIPAFRRGVDAWRTEGDLRGKWTDFGFAVAVSGRSGLAMKYDRYPGMKPFRGADEIVLKLKSDSRGKATAELVVFGFPANGKEPIKFYAPVSGATRFKTGLDPAKCYQIASVSIRREKDRWGWACRTSTARP